MSGPALLTPKSSQKHDDVKIEMGQSSTTPSNSDVENKSPPKFLGLERRFSVVPRSPTYPETPVVVITQEGKKKFYTTLIPVKMLFLRTFQIHKFLIEIIKPKIDFASGHQIKDVLVSETRY